MKKYAIILTAALFVCAFSGCDEEAPLPYIPVEKPVSVHCVIGRSGF